MSLKHIELASNEKMTSVEDECDSNLLINTNRKPVRFEAIDNDNDDDNNNNENQDNSSLTKINPLRKAASPPLITQKVSAPAFNPKLVQVRPVVAAVRSTQKSPNRHRIDKIVDNLKINILQKEKNPAQAPKVSLVSANKLKESQSKLNEPVAMTKPEVTQVDRKKLAQKYHNLILKNLEVSIEESEREKENESDEEISGLNWLTKFNLASTGLKPISPPQTPPRQLITHTSHGKMPSAKLAPLLTKPIVNPFIKKSVPNLNLSDEADGCYSPSRKQQPVGSSSDITSVIKRMLPEHVVNPHQRPPYSFSCLTFMAIESSPRKRLSVKEIYNWVTENLPYYRSVPSGSWKNSIRHNLSFNTCFCKVDKNLLAMRDFSGKGSLWCVNPENRALLLETMNKEPSASVLAAISLLQDVAETPRIVSTISNTSAEESSPNRTPSLLNANVRTGLKVNNTSKKKNNSIQMTEAKNAVNKM
jgi:hypothetical protein